MRRPIWAGSSPSAHARPRGVAFGNTREGCAGASPGLRAAPASEGRGDREVIPANNRAAVGARLALRLDRRGRRPDRLRVAVAARGPDGRHARALRRAAPAAAFSRRSADSLLHRAHGVADVHRLCGGAPVYLHLRLRRGQEYPRAQGHAAAAGHSAVGARAGISLRHGDRLPGAVSGQSAGSRVRQHLRHLYGAGVEHDVRLLSLADHHSGRAAGSRLRLPNEPLAALHESRIARLGDRPDVELDDELRRRLVLCRAERSDLRLEQEHQAARFGVVHGCGGRSGRHACRRLRHPGDDHHDPGPRPAGLAAPGRVGREVQARADRGQGQPDLVGAESVAPLLRAGLVLQSHRTRRLETFLSAPRCSVRIWRRPFPAAPRARRKHCCTSPCGD